MQVDYLIVGAGIAGSILADHLLKANKSVVVIDEPNLSNSSKVAGGLYNPITGRKMVKTWNCDQLFDYLIPYYIDLQQRMGVNFLREIPIYRPFFSIEEQNEWMAKSADSAYSSYILEIKQRPEWEAEVQNPYGGILLAKSGYLDTALLIKTFKGFLEDQGHLIQEEFEHSRLRRNDSGYLYNDIEIKNVVFCDGRLSQRNSYFSWLPYNLVKGELLFIKTNVTPRVIHNRGVFVIPIGEGMCKCGSTYQHKQLDEIPTIEAKNELIERVKNLVNFDFEIVDQKAGVRPATKDRKPFIGEHPKEKGIWIFNGLGTKGVSIAPYYAKQLVDAMEFGQQLDDDVNIERFFSLF